MGHPVFASDFNMELEGEMRLRSGGVGWSWAFGHGGDDAVRYVLRFNILKVTCGAAERVRKMHIEVIRVT